VFDAYYENKNGQCVNIAAKVIKLKGPKAEAKVDEEFKIQHRLQHPSILQVYDTSKKSSNEIIIWMELVTGGELFNKVLEQSRLDESEGSRLMKEVTEGLAYIHGEQIAHMDIKLENILLTGDNHAKIIDFGLSLDYTMAKNKNPSSAGARGSPSYAAPEVLAGRSYDGYKADVWSLGVTIFGSQAGYFPFTSASASDPAYRKVQAAQRSGASTVDAIFSEYDRTSHFSQHLQDLLDHMLIIDTKDRFTMEQVLESSWIKDGPAALLEMGRVTLPDVPPDAPKLQRQNAKML